MKTIIEINEANFEAEVVKAVEPVLLDFSADWCGPCKALSPMLDEIAAEYAGRVKIGKVNVDENPELAGQFNIRSVPTLLYFAEGEVRDQIIGLSGRKVITAKLDNLLLTTKERVP